MILPNNWPNDFLLIDFETYFDKEYSLSKLSTINYIKDEKFEPICIGYYHDGHTFVDFNPDAWIRVNKKLYGDNFENVTVIAKNVKFDISILTEHYGVWPPYVIDVQDLTHMWDARMKHSLAKVAKMFKLNPKGDTKQFMGLHRQDFLDDYSQQEKMRKYCKNDVKLEWQLFQMLFNQLLPQHDYYNFELQVAKHTLDMYINKSFKLDLVGAYELKEKMEFEQQETAAATGHSIEELSKNKYFVKLLKEALPEGESVPMKQGKRGLIPALAKNDNGMYSLLNHPDESVRKLAKARQAVKSWPLHINRVGRLIRQAEATDGHIGAPLVYWGCVTGRYSGTEKVNFQNFGGKGRGVPLHPLIAAVRGLLMAPEGCLLGISDSEQIEARVLAWFAGQDDLLEGFAKDEDVYSIFGKDIFGHRIWKPKGNEPEPIKKLLSIQRGFAKDTILGAGYGMGTLRFYNNCYANPNLKPLFDSGKYSYGFVDKLIKKYRKKYSRIPKFWKDLEKAFKWVIKYPSKTVSISEGRVSFYRKGTSVWMVLPSGREIQYRHASIGKNGNIKYHWSNNIWAGHITENLVQAVSRDLLVHWTMELKKHYPVILSVHDETVSLVPENDSKAKKIITDCMCSRPAWLDDKLPLSAETELSERYKK